MKRPAFQFYPADWRKDAGAQSCSIAARGLWLEMLCIMHECDPYGHLRINGQSVEASQLGRLVGISSRECSKLIAELESNGVFSRDEDGSIYSRRMVRDEATREKRAAGGVSGGEHGEKGKEHGKKGGRPKTDKGGLEEGSEGGNNGGYKTPLPNGGEPPIKPPPSSSTSSSSSPSGNSEAKASGDATLSPRDRLWRDGPGVVSALTGKSEADSRKLIGGWLKGNTQPQAVLKAIATCQAEKPIDPVPFIAACLIRQRQQDPSAGTGFLPYQVGGL